MHYALAGNPNSGKTTLFNLLTGSNQTVGNWPGVTVEKKHGALKDNKNIQVTDLPGIYSLSPYSMEEVITRDFLLDEKPSLIINLIDASNLERNLYLSTQLLELGIPMVIALNMTDVLEKKGIRIDTEILSRELGCPVVEISALRERGISQLLETARKTAATATESPAPKRFQGSIEHALAHIEEALLHDLPDGMQRFYAIKLFERDRLAAVRLGLGEEALSHIEQDIAACEMECGDDAESIIADGRYGIVSGLTAKCLSKKTRLLPTLTDRIDRIATHRLLAIPVFALVMTLVYLISVTTVGAWLTDYTNDVFFGGFVLPGASGFLESIGTAPWLTGLVVDGMIGGVGAVLGFVPQMLVLFALLSLLEGSGYMARVGFIMDRMFRRIGLSGKSIIPMLIGTGCGVPGVMACRTIESDRDRRMTIMTTTFIPCSAKLPVIALIAGALFHGAWWVAPSAYFAGAGAVILSGLILKKSSMFAGKPAPFIMEMPEYHLPRAKDVLRNVLDRGWSFVRKAGTVILISSVVIWTLTNLGWSQGRLVLVDDFADGFLAMAGGLIAPLFAPLGFGDWQSAVATLTGIVAKENVVGTFGVLFGFGDGSGDTSLWSALAAHFTGLAAYSFLIFNLLCAPCIAAISTIGKEMNSARWTWFAILYQSGFAYGVALVVYQGGLFLQTGNFTPGTLAAVMVLAAVGAYLMRGRGRKREDENFVCAAPREGVCNNG